MTYILQALDKDGVTWVNCGLTDNLQYTAHCLGKGKYRALLAKYGQTWFTFSV